MAGYIPFPCSICGTETERRSATQRYCEPCGRETRLQGHRRRSAKYEASRPPRRRDKPEDNERRRRWAEQNHEKRLASVRAYNERNRAEINRKAKERRAIPEVKEQRREIDRNYRDHPKRRVDQRMKAAVHLALKGRKAGRSWERLVGYSLADLVAHLERQFLPGMTWENVGRWHIDHIVPKVAFRYETAEDPEFRACWALTNLRPLWARDNHSKHARVTHLL